MRIDSNIRDVIAGIDRLRKGAHGAVQKALQPGLWQEEARSVAEQTLRGLADRDQAGYVSQFVQAVSAESLANGMRLTLDAHAGSLNVMGTIAGHLATQGLPLLMGLVDGDVERLESLILQWVQEEKEKTDVDSGKTDEQIAEKLRNILLDADRTEARVNATERLVPHLQDFFDRTQGVGGLSPDVVDAWLRAVSSVWIALLTQRLGERVTENLSQLLEG